MKTTLLLQLSLRLPLHLLLSPVVALNLTLVPGPQLWLRPTPPRPSAQRRLREPGVTLKLAQMAVRISIDQVGQ